jgi:leucyl aminopeptidase (aminopeptidase T)
VLDSSLSSIGTDEIENAARVAVASVIALAPEERFVVFTDRPSARVGFALAGAAERAGARITVVDLDVLGVRPLKALPDRVVAELSHSDASAFVAASRHAELGLRQHLLHVTQSARLRHAHMPGISVLAFARGLRIDYSRVRAFGQRLLGKLEPARTLEAQSAAGTHLTVELSDDTRWFGQLGVLEPGRWGNLPAGALYASPSRIEGVFVANAALGEYFGEREGCLLDRPVRFSVTAGRVTRVEAPRSPELCAEIERMLAFSPNSDRVGLIAIGVNSGVAAPTGEALVDQNMPGLHLAIGDPAASVTGADYSAPTCFAACEAESTVLVDGVIAIHRGKLLSPS